MRSMVLEHAGELLLGLQLLALHQTQGVGIDRQHAKFGIQDLFVQLSMAVVELTELRVGLHQGFDFGLLTFEHRESSGVVDRSTSTGRDATSQKGIRVRTSCSPARACAPLDVKSCNPGAAACGMLGRSGAEPPHPEPTLLPLSHPFKGATPQIQVAGT
jgi:hypothetical protein